MLEKEDLEIKRNNNEKSCEKENSTEKPRKLAKNKTKKESICGKTIFNRFFVRKKSIFGCREISFFYLLVGCLHFK